MSTEKKNRVMEILNQNAGDTDWIRTLEDIVDYVDEEDSDLFPDGRPSRKTIEGVAMSILQCLTLNDGILASDGDDSIIYIKDLGIIYKTSEKLSWDERSKAEHDEDEVTVRFKQLFLSGYHSDTLTEEEHKEIMTFIVNHNNGFHERNAEMWEEFVKERNKERPGSITVIEV